MPTLIDFPAFIPYKWFMTERQDSIVDPTKLTCFTCRLCRSALFSDKDLEPHATGAQRINRRKVGRSMDASTAHIQACTSYFLNEAAMESLEWVRAALQAHDEAIASNSAVQTSSESIEGKLVCPNARCAARLGSFNWSGTQCSCGSWVVPAVQVVGSKVDRKGTEETEGLMVVDFGAQIRKNLEVPQQQENCTEKDKTREGREEATRS